jgi:hypothetical protein
MGKEHERKKMKLWENGGEKAYFNLKDGKYKGNHDGRQKINTGKVKEI